MYVGLDAAVLLVERDGKAVSLQVAELHFPARNPSAVDAQVLDFPVGLQQTLGGKGENAAQLRCNRIPVFGARVVEARGLDVQEKGELAQRLLGIPLPFFQHEAREIVFFQSFALGFNDSPKFENAAVEGYFLDYKLFRLEAESSEFEGHARICVKKLNIAFAGGAFGNFSLTLAANCKTRAFLKISDYS